MKKIVFIIGESGSGKTYAQFKLIEKDSERFCKITSTVSRNPREGEIEGIDYHYKSREEFESLISNNELLQYVEFGGNYYGTQLSEYKKEQDTAFFACTAEGINDTINALKNHSDINLEYSIVYFMPSRKKLEEHGIDEERAARGDISKNFLERYSKGEFEGINVRVITDDMIGENVDTFLSLASK